MSTRLHRTTSSLLLVSTFGLAMFGMLRRVDAFNMANSNPPEIQNVATVLFGGILYVTGYVVDDSNPTGCVVAFSGDVSGTAVVGEDGRFWFSVPFYHPYGSAIARTRDRDGVKSDTVSFEFYE